jgi:hypothetical protein
MRIKWLVGAVLAATLGLPLVAQAHGGHVHTVMGTVASRQDKRLDVKSVEGKTVTIVLTEKTSVLRGKQKLELNAIQQGDRVVVDVGDGKEPLTAREVKLGDVRAAAAK